MTEVAARAREIPDPRPVPVASRLRADRLDCPSDLVSDGQVSNRDAGLVPLRMAGDGPGEHAPVGRRAAGLQPPELIWMSSSLASHCGRPLNFVARSTLFVPVLGILMRSVGGIPDPARGDGSLRHEGDAEAPPRRRDRYPVPGGDAQPRRRARTAEVGHRGPRHAGQCARRSGRTGGDLRGLAPLAQVARPSSDPDPLRPARSSPRNWRAWRPTPSRR